MALLKLVNIWYKYPGTDQYALKNIDLELYRGKTYLVTGPNGAGKSTLLMIMAGLLKPVKGQVLFRDKPLDEQIPSIRRFFGLLFQNPEDMLFNPRVYDEIAFALRQLLRDEEEVREKILGIIGELGIPQNILDKPVHMLSYGEKKLVALASILVYDPLIILLDEPYTNLADKYIEKINKYVLRARENGKTIVIASHRYYVDKELFDEEIYIEKGEILLKTML